MSKERFRYDSQRTRADYTFHPARSFALEYSQTPGKCYLVAMDQQALEITRLMWSIFPKYHWVWGLSSPRSSWTDTQQTLWSQIEAFVTETEICLMSCLEVEVLNTQLTRIADGLETLTAKFETDNWIAPNQTIADILANSLFGRYIDPIPDPLTGTGLSDILDEQVETLHNRFVQSDFSFPASYQKNITETLEHVLRKSGVLDFEMLPNIADVLDRTLRVSNEGLVELVTKKVLTWIRGQLSPELDEQLGDLIDSILGENQEEEDPPETVAEILLMMLLMEQKGQGDLPGGANLQQLVAAIRKLDLSTSVVVKNCNCAGDCDCEGQTVYSENGHGDAGGLPGAGTSAGIGAGIEYEQL